MARRSVSLPPNLERTVRRLQATLLTTMDRDISFTETLNLALAAAFAVPDLARRVTTEEWQTLLEGSDWDAEGVLAKKKREILDAISDQRSTVVPADAETLNAEPNEPSDATPEPETPITLAAPIDRPTPAIENTESSQAPDPAFGWPEPASTFDEPAYAASGPDLLDFDPTQAEEPASSFRFAAPVEEVPSLDSMAAWGEPDLGPTDPSAFETEPADLPTVMPPFNFGSLAEDLGAIPEVQENPAPLMSWEETPSATVVPDMVEIESQTRSNQPETSPSPFDPPTSPFFMVQPPVIDPDWHRPEPSVETPPSDFQAEVENEPIVPASDTDREVYDDLARALEEAAAAYEQTLNSDES